MIASSSHNNALRSHFLIHAFQSKLENNTDSYAAGWERDKDNVALHRELNQSLTRQE